MIDPKVQRYGDIALLAVAEVWQRAGHPTRELITSGLPCDPGTFGDHVAQPD